MLLDRPEVVRRKVARAVTDSLGMVRFTPDQAGLYNLLSMLHLLSGEHPESLVERYQDRGYRAVKDDLAECIVAALDPIQTRYSDFESDPGAVDEVLEIGAERAKDIAKIVLATVRERMGLRSRYRVGTPTAAI